MFKVKLMNFFKLQLFS